MHSAESSPATMKVIIAWFLNNFRYYVIFSKSIFFVLGLLLTYRFVEYAVFNILVTHITDEWEELNLSTAVAIVNFKDGAYEVLQIFFAYISDAYSGLFPLLITSTILYIVGLVLSTIAVSGEEAGVVHHGIFFTAIVLITLSQSAERVTLKSFLGGQILTKDDDEKRIQEYEGRAISRGKFWWNIVSVLAAIVAIIVSSKMAATVATVVSWKIDKFEVLSMASAVAMGVAFLWFLLGTRFYTRVKPAGSPLSNVFGVMYTAVAKRNVEYQQSPEQLQPHVSWLRWLDKAAIVVQDQENPGNKNFCTADQVMGVKFLLKMLPLWPTFLTFSLVTATGSTFFLEEAKYIKFNKEFPVVFFIILERFTQFVVAEISDHVLEKIGKKKNNNIVQRLILVRIGIGMICCLLCCIAAWINALHWLNLVSTKQEWETRGLTYVFRMVPQYLLLGAMEGLSGDGLEKFFDSQVSKSISRYGPSFGKCVMGVGKFWSVVWILILNDLFKNDVKHSHLDKYYAILTGLSMMNFAVYWLVAYWYGDGNFPVEDYAEDIGPVSKQSQPLQLADDLPLFHIKIVTQNQKAASPSDSNDDKAERTNCDIGSTEHISSGLANGLSDRSQLLSEVRTFPRMFSRRFSKRFNSMH